MRDVDWGQIFASLARQYGFTRDDVLGLTLEEVGNYMDWARFFWQTEMAAMASGTVRRAFGG